MKVNTKQICMIIFTILPASKFLILPSVYANLAHQDVWFAGLLNFLIDGLLLTVMLLLIKKFGNQSFYDVLEANFGKATAKTVYFIYALYFLLKSTVPLFEQKNFTEITLYETSPTVLTFLPFFALCFYMCMKGYRTFARTGEILFWLTIIGLGGVIFLSLSTTQPYLLMPVLKNPLKQTLTAVYSGLMWYGQPIILLFFMGSIKREKGFNRSIIISFVCSALVCVIMFALFTSIYGELAPRQIYALTRMTKYSITLSNVGRFDYVATLLITLTSMLSLVAPLLLSVECLRAVFGSKRIWILSLAVNGIMFLVLFIFQLYYQAVADLFTKFLTPIMLLLVYVVPVLTLFLKGKKNAVS